MGCEKERAFEESIRSIPTPHEETGDERGMREETGVQSGEERKISSVVGGDHQTER